MPALTFLEADTHDREPNASSPLTIFNGTDDVAQVFSSADSTVETTREQAIAYVRLFVASPDLFDALREQVRLTAMFMRKAGYDAEDIEANTRKAKAVLAKARRED